MNGFEIVRFTCSKRKNIVLDRIQAFGFEYLLSVCDFGIEDFVLNIKDSSIIDYNYLRIEIFDINESKCYDAVFRFNLNYKNIKVKDLIDLVKSLCGDLKSDNSIFIRFTMRSH